MRLSTILDDGVCTVTGPTYRDQEMCLRSDSTLVDASSSLASRHHIPSIRMQAAEFTTPSRVHHAINSAASTIEGVENEMIVNILDLDIE